MKEYYVVTFPETSLRLDGLCQIATIRSNRRVLKSLVVQNLRRTYAGYVRPSMPALVHYLCVVVLPVGACLPASSITVGLRDFQQVLLSIMQARFRLTPVGWDSARLPSYGQKMLAHNSARYIVSGYRHALMPKIFAAPTAFDAAAFWVTTLRLLMIGSICFRRQRSHFRECL